MVRKELLLSPRWACAQPPSSSFPGTLWFSPKQVLSRGVSSITRKAASGCWSNRAGPYAGQTACVGHPCRAHGICSPSLGSGFQYGAGAKAPQLPKEMKKKSKEWTCQNPHFFHLPLLSRATPVSSQLLPLSCPLIWWRRGKIQLRRWEKALRWPWGWEQHSPIVTMGLWYGRSPKEPWLKPCP